MQKLPVRTIQGLPAIQNPNPGTAATTVGHAEHAAPTTVEDNHQATQSVGVEIEVTAGHVKEEQIDIRATSQRTPRRAPSHQTAQMQPTKKGLSATAVIMIVVGGLCLLAVMIATSISVGVSIGHSRERHQAMLDKQVILMPAPAESEPIVIYDGGTAAATKPAAAAPSLNPSAPAAPTAQDSVAALEQTFEHTLASGEDASLLERACSLLALKHKAITKLPTNAKELEKSRGLNGVETNGKLPKIVGKPIQVSCDLESPEGKQAIGWAKTRRAQVLGE